MSRFFYAKFKNGLAVEGIDTFSEIISPDLIQVNSLPENFLFKKYENEIWVEVPSQKIAQINSEGKVIYVTRTFFPEDFADDYMITEEAVEPGWAFIDGTWLEPEVTDGSN
jgi:hypothetical protein